MQQIGISPRPLATERSPWLRGMLAVPGDAAITHLALACGALAHGWSEIRTPLDTARVRAFAETLECLGAHIIRDGERWYATGTGVGCLLEPPDSIVFGGSSYGLELLVGLAGTSAFVTRIEGAHPSLAGCRLGGILRGLEALGSETMHAEGGRLPVTLRGATVGLPAAIPLPAEAPGAKPALALAALAVPGITSLIEERADASHPERMLRRFGADVLSRTQEEGGQRVEIRGLPELHAQHVDVPADTGLAALGAVAASIVPASDLAISGALVNPARTPILSALVAMGAHIEVQSLRESGGEEVADLAIRHAGLRSIALAAEYVAPLLDDLPMVAVAAACAEGTTVLELPPRLPLETHGRIAAIARGLSVNGVGCEAEEERLIIHGTGRVSGGGRVITTGDPDLALAFLVLGMAADDQVTVSDQSGIEDRFPGFLDSFENVGASFVRYSD